MNNIPCIKETYKKYFTIPSEFQDNISTTSIKCLNFISIIVFAFGLIFFIFSYFKVSKTDILYISHLIYYGAFCLSGFILYFMSFPLRKIKGKIYLKKAIVIAGICIFMFNDIYLGFVQDNTIVDTVSFFLVEYLVIVTFMNINPVVFGCLTTSMLTILAFIADYRNQDINYLHFTILVLALFILGFVKRYILTSEKKRIIALSKQNEQLNSFNDQLSGKKLELLRLKNTLETEVSLKALELKNKNENIIKLQNHTILSLSSLVENRDKDTGMHVIRTREYVKALAVESRKKGIFSGKLNEKYIKLMERSAPLHDIGKIVVSDAILKKPARLTTDEFSQMKKHTMEGVRIVREVLGNEEKDYIDIACSIAKSHHEKWDGSGYPEGLSREDIPLCARFMAIADVFDALVSPRCYKEPMSDDEAFSIILEGKGTHFDPLLVDVFMNSRDKILEIKEKYSE